MVKITDVTDRWVTGVKLLIIAVLKCQGSEARCIISPTLVSFLSAQSVKKWKVLCFTAIYIFCHYKKDQYTHIFHVGNTQSIRPWVSQHHPVSCVYHETTALPPITYLLLYIYLKWHESLSFFVFFHYFSINLSITLSYPLVHLSVYIPPTLKLIYFSFHFLILTYSLTSPSNVPAFHLILHFLYPSWTSLPIHSLWTSHTIISDWAFHFSIYTPLFLFLVKFFCF